MNILIATDSFKGSLSSNEISYILKNKLLNSGLDLNIKTQELADGGEGSIDVIKNAVNYFEINLKVLNPLGIIIPANYLFDKKNKVAYIEFAKASGLTLVKDNLDVMFANSFGTGELIKDAIEKGAKKIILFLGGSATNDAGLGILNALGVDFFDIKNKKLDPNPYSLKEIVRIDDSNFIKKYSKIKFIAAVDVNNFFYGKNGAAQVYAAQKGANNQQINFLDESLKSFSEVILKKYLVNLQNKKGSGSAGGVAGSLYAILGAKISFGADIIFKIVNLEKKIKRADIIITGEGKIDNQTLNNKLIYKVSEISKKYNKKLWAVCGFFEKEKDLQKKLNLNKVFSLAKNKNDIKASMNYTKERLILIGNELIKDLNAID